jgi:spore coat polysaccharide biosynthesis protein SpsF
MLDAVALMRTVAIIQARLGSVRRPGKVLADLAGRPLIAHVVERVRACAGVDQVVVAIPWTPEQAPLAEALAACPVAIFRGAEHDVLDRYVTCARAYQAEVVLRVTGDCPLWAPEVGARVLGRTIAGEGRYVADLRQPGCDAEAMTVSALAWAAAQPDPDREHVTGALRASAAVGDVAIGEAGRPWLAVDTPADLARVRTVHAALDDPRDFSLAATLRAWMAAGRP